MRILYNNQSNRRPSFLFFLSFNYLVRERVFITKLNNGGLHTTQQSIRLLFIFSRSTPIFSVFNCNNVVIDLCVCVFIIINFLFLPFFSLS